MEATPVWVEIASICQCHNAMQYLSILHEHTKVLWSLIWHIPFIIIPWQHTSFYSTNLFHWIIFAWLGISKMPLGCKSQIFLCDRFLHVLWKEGHDNEILLIRDPTFVICRNIFRLCWGSWLHLSNTKIMCLNANVNLDTGYTVTLIKHYFSFICTKPQNKSTTK